MEKRIRLYIISIKRDVIQKAIQELYTLAQSHMIGHSLFDSDPIGNIFYSHMVIFEIPEWHFKIKPTPC